MEATTQQKKSALAVMVAVSETIREMGQAPRGTIYAALMSHGCDFQAYEKVESILIGSGLVEKRGNVLHWVGPMLSEARS